jgi:phage tail-like protein
MNASYLPKVARPPHDPRSRELCARLGWSSATLAGVTQNTGIVPDRGVIALTPLPGSGRTLAEPSGSFGGLTLPRNIARLADGRLILLDHAVPRLLVFDPCACGFVPFPCIRPGDVRLPADCVAIAIVGTQLLLPSPGAGRVIVLDALTGSSRAVWQAAPGKPAWYPVACLALPHQLVAIADPAQGGVHLCSRQGRALRFIGGLGAVFALTLDCHGNLYVARSGDPDVLVVDLASGRVTGSAARPEEIAAHFPPLSVPVRSDGSIDVAACCEPPQTGPSIVDTHGNPVSTPEPDADPIYPPEGTWISGPLDSEISGCVWDRVTLTAQLPQLGRVQIATCAADVLLTDADLADENRWQSAGTLRYPAAVDCVADDFMLHSPGGRYLWLRLRLAGTPETTPAVSCIQIDFPRVSLRRYLPEVFGTDAVAAEFTDRWLAILDRTLRGIEHEIDDQARLFDPLAAPAFPEVPADHDFLAYLARWVGVSLYAAFPLARRRRLVKLAPRLYPWRGTLPGFRAALALFLGLDRLDGLVPATRPCVPCVERAALHRCAHAWRAPRLVLEHFQLRRWMALGHARLSDAAKLWGERIVNRSRLANDTDLARGAALDGAQLGVTQLDTVPDPQRDPLLFYANRIAVFVPVGCARNPPLASALASFIASEKPAHVKADLIVVEPRFRVGVQAMLGLDAVIGVRPAPVVLDTAALGRGTVLEEAGTTRPTPPRGTGRNRIGMNSIIH